MKSSSLIFFAAFLALAASWGGFVLAPQIQLGRAGQTKTLGTGDVYPLARPGLQADEEQGQQAEQPAGDPGEEATPAHQKACPMLT